MAEYPLVQAVRQLRFLLGRHTHEHDFALLDRFMQAGDESAFELLVQRHGPMVWRTCQRLAHQAADAEDAFQATFLVLCRKGGAISRRESLGGWLHQVAYRIALKASARRAFQPLPEEQSPALEDDPAAPLMHSELRLLLDEALSGLPRKYRVPLVLCALEGKTRATAAAELGWAEGTLSSRLAKGKELLRARLLRRGVTLSAGALAALLDQEGAAQTLPPALLRVTLKVHTWFLPGQAATEQTVQAISLAEGALHGMFLTKLKTAALVLVATGLLAIAAGKVTQQVLAHQPVADPQALVTQDEQPAAPPQVSPPAVTVTPARQVARTMRVVVLGPQGKLLPGAKIHASVWTEEKGFKANRDYQTDAAGVAQVELPKTLTILRLWASKKPLVTLFADWEQNELAGGNLLPAEYTFRLEPGVSAGGRIVDEHGKPIAGARVQVMLANELKPPRGDSRVRYDMWLAEGTDAATTDAAGRWRIDNAPTNTRAELRLLVTHPQYISDEGWGHLQTAAGITSEALRQQAAKLTMKPGVIVSGQVTNPNGQPVKNAIVILGDDPYSADVPRKFPTGADGRYCLPPLAPQETTLSVLAAGWAPQLRKVALRPGLPPQDFHLKAGKPIRLRIVDAAGNPLPEARVNILEWKGSQSIQSMHNPNHPKVPDTRIPRQTDAHGIWEWPSAPDEPVKLTIGKKGFFSTEVEIAGGAPERTIVLRSQNGIIGPVTDARTSKPIPAFTVIPIDLYRKDFACAHRTQAMRCKDGRLDYRAERRDNPLRLRVEALGYRTQDGPEFRVGAEMSRPQEFRLQPSPPVTGVVLDPAGQPVAQAGVLLSTPTEEATIAGDGSLIDNHQCETDSTGRFTFPDPGEPWAVVAQAGAGFALTEFPAGQHDAGTLQLRPWASIRGRFLDSGHPLRGATVLLQLVRRDGPDRPRITVLLRSMTDQDGRFEFARVPPVPVVVRVYLGPWKEEGFRSAPSVPLDLQAGQHVELDLGRAGVAIGGKVKLTGNVPADLDCTYSLNYLVRRAPGIPPPPDIANLGSDARNGWRDAWRQTREGLAYLSTLYHWFVKLAPDGAFRISGVPPGEYDLSIAVYAKPKC